MQRQKLIATVSLGALALMPRYCWATPPHTTRMRLALLAMANWIAAAHRVQAWAISPQAANTVGAQLVRSPTPNGWAACGRHVGGQNCKAVGVAGL